MEAENFDLLRACHITDFRDDPDTKLHLQVNRQKTAELQAEPKHVRFRKWCEENGVLTPGVEYPVVFGEKNCIVGMAASKDVAPMTAFLYVPFHLIICEHNIRRRCPDLSTVYDSHPELFKTHREAEYNLLIIFIMREITLGDKSFYYAYLEIINRPDLPFMWYDSELDEF